MFIYGAQDRQIVTCIIKRGGFFTPSLLDHVLLQTNPEIAKALLQLIDVTQTTLVHSFIVDADEIKVWAVGRPEVRTDDVERFQLRCCIRLHFLNLCVL